MVNEKINQARQHNLGVIYCLGQNLEQYEADTENQYEVIATQL